MKKYVLILVLLFTISCDSPTEIERVVSDVTKWEHVIGYEEYIYSEQFQHNIVIIYDGRFEFGYDYSIWLIQNNEGINVQYHLESEYNGDNYYQLLTIADGMLFFYAKINYVGWKLLIIKKEI